MKSTKQNNTKVNRVKTNSKGKSVSKVAGKKPSVGNKRKSSPKVKTTNIPKRFELRALGYSFEVTAHRLNAKELQKVKEYCEQEGISVGEDVGDLEEVLSTYNRYDTNLWQISTVPIVGSCVFGLYNSDNHEIFTIKDPRTQSTLGRENYVAKKGKGDVVVACEEYKGTSAVWALTCDGIPLKSAFNFRLGSVSIDGDKTFFVEGVDYKGQELEREYDDEFLVGKAFSSYLL